MLESLVLFKAVFLGFNQSEILTRGRGAYLCIRQALSHLMAVLLEGIIINSAFKSSVVPRPERSHIFLRQYIVPTVTQVGVFPRLN